MEYFFTRKRAERRLALHVTRISIEGGNKTSTAHGLLGGYLMGVLRVDLRAGRAAGANAETQARARRRRSALLSMAERRVLCVSFLEDEIFISICEMMSKMLIKSTNYRGNMTGQYSNIFTYMY